MENSKNILNLNIYKLNSFRLTNFQIYTMNKYLYLVNMRNLIKTQVVIQ